MLISDAEDDRIAIDPSHMILDSANLIEHLNSAQTLTDYIAPVIGNSALAESAIERLIGIGALSSNKKITKFGKFLASSGIRIELGSILFHFIKTVKVTTTLPLLVSLLRLLDSGKYLSNSYNKDQQEHFYTFLQSRKFPSDYDLYLFLLINLNDEEEARNIGVNYYVIEEARKSAFRTLESLDIEVSEVVSVPNIDTLLREAMMLGFGHTLCQHQYGNNYLHLASDTTVVVSHFSLLSEFPPFILVTAVGKFGYNNYYVNNPLGITLDDITSCYNSGYYIQKNQSLQSFDPENGMSVVLESVAFQDQSLGQEHPRIIGSNTLNYNGGHWAYLGMAQIATKQALINPSNIELLERLKHYLKYFNDSEVKVTEFVSNHLVQYFTQKTIWSNDCLNSEDLCLEDTGILNACPNINTISPAEFEGYRTKYEDAKIILDISIQDLMCLVEVLEADALASSQQMYFNHQGQLYIINDSIIDNIQRQWVSDTQASILQDITGGVLSFDLNQLPAYLDSLDKCRVLRNGVERINPITGHKFNFYITINQSTYWGSENLVTSIGQTPNQSLRDIIFPQLRAQIKKAKEEQNQLKKIEEQLAKLKDSPRHEEFSTWLADLRHAYDQCSAEFLLKQINQDSLINRGPKAEAELALAVANFRQLYSDIWLTKHHFQDPSVLDNPIVYIASLIIDEISILSAYITQASYDPTSPTREDPNLGKEYLVLVCADQDGPLPKHWGNISIENYAPMIGEKAFNKLAAMLKLNTSQPLVTPADNQANQLASKLAGHWATKNSSKKKK
jgi:hypothetical protein